MSNLHLTDARELILFALCKYGGAVCLEAEGRGVGRQCDERALARVAPCK